MDLIDRLHELSARAKRQLGSVKTEEAAKTAFVMPFLQALGYDVFNPDEVIPELTADHGVKKGEKVDYAIRLNDQIVILFECKPVGADLTADHAGQLYRYFSVTDARFGVLTDGLKYVFFSDLEKENKMDERPFFEFNLLTFDDEQVEELKKFAKGWFDLDTIISTASNLKYHRALLAELRQEYEHPSEDLVRFLTARVYSGRFTQQVREQFTELVREAFRDFVGERVNERLKSALDSEGKQAPKSPEPTAQSEEASQTEDSVTGSGVVTTEEELQSHRIIQAIGAEVCDPARIALRDAKSYCAILFDDNNRKTICRLYYKKTKNTVRIFVPEQEVAIDIASPVDLYRRKDAILSAVRQYLQD